MKYLTDYVQVGDMDSAFYLILGFAGVLFLVNFFENLGYYISDINMVATSTTIAHKVLTHIHNLDFAYHTNKSSGKLISLMKRGDDAFYTYYDILNRQILSITISFAMLFYAFLSLRNHYMIFVMTLIVVTLLLTKRLVAINIKKRNEFNDADDEISSLRVDNLVNFDTVKYFANEHFEQNRFAKLLQTWDQKLQAYFFTFRYFDTIIGNISNFALVGMILIALYDLKNAHITFGDFLLIVTFAMTLFPRMMHLLFSIRELAKKYSDLQNYFGILDEKITVLDPQNPDTLVAPRGEISFENVTFKYENKKYKVLNKFDLKIKAGEVVALVGYSGAGKTTIAKLLMRMYDPQDGRVAIDGVDVKNVLKKDLRKVVGLVPQDPLLFNNSVFYNIQYANQTATKEQVEQAANSARVNDFIKNLPQGYDTIVGERGIKLSGGQRQRLAIARVFLEQPKILILDEATSALDSASEKLIQEAFWELVRDKENKRTSIIIAHRLSTIMKADRIIVMDKGKIAEIGSHDELLKNSKGIYYSLWSLQKNGFIADGEAEV